MTVRRPPEQWEKIMGIQIMDADGWDRTNLAEDWKKPLSQEEFIEKAVRSTTFSRKKKGW